MASEIEILVHDPDIHPLLYEQTAEGQERLRSYLTAKDRENWHKDLDPIEMKLNDPTERKQMSNLGRIATQFQARKKNLDHQTPPPLTTLQRDKLHKLEQATETAFREGMVSDEEMRRRTETAVDTHMAWEKVNKPLIMLWKNCRKLLNPDSKAPNLTNPERFRPSRPTVNLDLNAQIPGIFALSAAAKAQFDQIDWQSPEAKATFKEWLDEAVADGRLKLPIQAKSVRRGLRNFNYRHKKGQGAEERLKAQATRDAALLIEAEQQQEAGGHA